MMTCLGERSGPDQMGDQCVRKKDNDGDKKEDVQRGGLSSIAYVPPPDELEQGPTGRVERFLSQRNA